MFIFLGLLAGVIYLFVNFSDKAIVSKYVTDWRVAVFFGSIAGGILALLVLPFNLHSLSPTDAGLIIFSGAILWVGYFIYWKVMSESNATYVTMLLQLSPVATLILSYLILGEELSMQMLVGLVLILLATVGFSFKKVRAKNAPAFNYKHFFLILITCVIFGIAAVIAKHTIEHTNFLVAVAWEEFGVFLAGLVAFVLSQTMRKSFIQTIKANWGLPIVFIFGVEALFIVSRFVSYAATGLGPVSVERALEGARIFFAFVFALILARAIPAVFADEKEEVTVRKIILAVVLFMGVYLFLNKAS
jgi:drug/metabolite transporter (DMT)-like permease